MKINTLVEDIYKVVDNQGGWSETISKELSKSLGDTLSKRLSTKSGTSKGTLRMSNLGTPCERKLWYEVNKKDEGETLRPPTKFKFLYGDVLEEIVLALARAAGHDVQGEQDELYINGIKGHRDAVIDGMLIDVKSASPYSFKKFKENNLKEEDPFGYIEQLSSYLYASQDDPLVTEKNKAGFLAVDKVNGTICLDVYDLTKEMEGKEVYVDYLKDMVDQTDEPKRGYKPVPWQKSGNMQLDKVCSYCSFKKVCFPEMRTFISSQGPVYLTDVKREPKMMEVTE